MRRENSIAVLPIIPLSSIKEDHFFCDGLSEEIINAISHLKELFVTSRTSSFHFKNTSLEVSEIAADLGVKYIIEGSLRRFEDQFKITIQIVNAVGDFHIWSEVFDFENENIFKIQESVATSVKDALKKLLNTNDKAENLISSPHTSIEAFELNLKAKDLSTDLSGSSVKLALELIEKALEIDPENDAFISTKALLVTTLGINGSWPLHLAGRQALDLCEEALRFNNKNMDALAVKGYLIFVITGDVDLFYENINTVLREKPRDVLALHFVSIIESALGNYNKSMEANELAYEIDPMSPLPKYLRFLNLMRLRKYEEALEEANNFVKDHPNHLNAHNIRGHILLRLKKPKEALKQWSNLPGPNGETIKFYGGISMAYAIMGLISKAEENLALSKQHDKNLNLSYCENPSVFVNLFLGRFEEAFSVLEEDVKIGKWYTRFYRANPYIDPILNNPRSAILENALVGTYTYGEVEKVKYAKSGLTEDDLLAIEIQLNDYIEEHKPFLDPKINLKKLAKKLNVSPNNLSQVINTQNNKNFFDYINSLRIKHLLEMLNDRQNEKFTILSLAYEAGFNSKSTFNASFKKLTGLTPTEYIKSIEVEV
ncbi:helix-turn-helix domain-containing protein [Paracrocinitomix mangrovi]|uniref:helix-turn-helix domain-containing protein n=1 Tax=Paracrocinitomix mangrovi TaxID=2862509 RepID=UPI001C8D1286|nr:helix-turn-helix domain-containing protein [Paracrocinitomix mangrovi]UKN00897.1 helix-turn-helix domain-containing protein [Paracrocinitomix mangrovi]